MAGTDGGKKRMDRKMYIAPTAEWMLLAPAEELMLGEVSEDDSFALKGWGETSMFGSSVPTIIGGGTSNED